MGKRQSLDPELERWCEARIEQLEHEAERLGALLRRPHWAALVPEPASDSALLTLMDDPVYAQVHALGQIFLSPRFQLPEDDALLEAPVPPSYELYELWTFLALQRVLARHMPGAIWTYSDIEKLKYFDENPNGASYTAEWPGHGRLGLYFNLEFRGFLAKNETPRRSISRARRPDLVVTWKPSRGRSAGSAWMQSTASAPACGRGFRVRPHLPGCAAVGGARRAGAVRGCRAAGARDGSEGAALVRAEVPGRAWRWRLLPHAWAAAAC